MNNQNEKPTFPKGKLTTFRPLPDAVFLHPELTLLQKFIMTDIISFQVNGKQYFKSSSKLADELSMSKRTIQTNFQQLQKKNIIRTKVVHTAGMMSRRYAELIDLNRWLTGKKEEIHAEEEVIISNTNQEIDDELKINSESDILEQKVSKDVVVEDELSTNVFDSQVVLNEFRLKKLNEFCSSTKAMILLQKQYESEYTKEEILEMLNKNDADALKLFHFVFGYDTAIEMFNYGWYDRLNHSAFCLENKNNIRVTQTINGHYQCDEIDEKGDSKQTSIIDCQKMLDYLKTDNGQLSNIDVDSIETINS